MAHPSKYVDPSTETGNAAIVRRTREITRESTAILRQNPRPDTFLGRKTQEPFPEENTD